MTTEELQAKLNELDGGVYKKGNHKSNSREFCMLEFDHALRGNDHSDRPGYLPDLRPWNDAFPDDQSRTAAILPVHAALWDWSKWPDVRRQAFAQYVVISLIQRIIAELPKLPITIANQCRQSTTLQSARGAAEGAAGAAEAAEAAEAARWAAEAAEAAETARAAEAAGAAEAARWAARAAWAAEAAKAKTIVLRQFGTILLDAARQTETIR